MSLTGKHILIVEDEASLVRVLADELREEGFSVSTASNGEEGLATALAEHPDLLLVDVVMPKMDGLTMVRKLREDAWGKNVGVIMLTNVSEAVTIDESFDRDVYEYIVKADWELTDIIRIAKKKLAVVV